MNSGEILIRDGKDNPDLSPVKGKSNDYRKGNEPSRVEASASKCKEEN